jgi:GTP-binding protein HflX
VAQLVDDAPPVAVRAPPGDGAAVAWLYRHGRVTQRTAEADGAVTLSVRLSPKALGQFEQMFPEAELRV